MGFEDTEKKISKTIDKISCNRTDIQDWQFMNTNLEAYGNNKHVL
jgi:imidazole glycerol phosphate synthase subunit HisF